MQHHRKVPTMTAGRSALVELMRRYLDSPLDPFVTLLEVHKLVDAGTWRNGGSSCIPGPPSGDPRISRYFVLAILHRDFNYDENHPRVRQLFGFYDRLDIPDFA